MSEGFSDNLNRPIIPVPEEGKQHPFSDKSPRQGQEKCLCKGEEIGVLCEETMSVDSRDKAKEPTLE